jgi:type I restriction enzyme S subunit
VSTKLLLAELKRLSDAPEAMPKFRDFVRRLAVSGCILETDLREWSHLSLGEVGAWGSGGTPNKAHHEYYDGDIPWLVIGDLNDGLVTAAASTITEDGLANSSAKIVEPGTVLVAMYGSIGKLGLAGIRCATNQAIAHCIVDSALVTSDFLMLALRSMRSDLLARGQGGTQPNISQTILKAWPISLPPISEQPLIVARVDELMALCDQL